MTNEYENPGGGKKFAPLTGVDLVRLTNTGTEATMHSLRIARAYTGRGQDTEVRGSLPRLPGLYPIQLPAARTGYRVPAVPPT